MMFNQAVLDEEFNNIKAFIKKKYSIDISQNAELSELVYCGLNLIYTLKVWDKHLDISTNIFLDAKSYLIEIISNTIHCIILATIDLKVPALIMLRRSQENILNFLYYSQHSVEYYKKELDSHSKNMNGFKDLKDYITTYPFYSKYASVDNQKVQGLCSKILIKWTDQYQSLSNFVHGSNSKYLENVQFFDELTLSQPDIKFLVHNLEQLGSIINSLLIIFFFDTYKCFGEETEKSPIRCCIQNEFGFKSCIIDLFSEI